MFNDAGNQASGYGPRPDLGMPDFDGHGVANACWGMVGYLNRLAELERSRKLAKAQNEKSQSHDPG
jgi:hypothetical protein